MLPTGEAADTPHLTWTEDRFTDGQAVVVELAGAHRRYHIPLARTLMLGRPSAQRQKLAGAVDEGIEAVLEVIRPGVVARDLAAWNSTLAQHGLVKPSRIGYSIGIAYPPDWGERTVSLRGEDETVLQENMTFHLMGGMWMDNYGYELSESIRVTADGVEAFTSLPREFISAGSRAPPARRRRAGGAGGDRCCRTSGARCLAHRGRRGKPRFDRGGDGGRGRTRSTSPWG
jgi:Xaa-Pro dipeptidase